MFFPYRACISLFQIPILTILLSVLCVGTFIAQYQNQQAISNAAIQYCDKDLGREFYRTLKRLGSQDEMGDCVGLMLTIHSRPDSKATIKKIVGVYNKPGTGYLQGNDYYEDIISKAYLSFRIAAPRDLTAQLIYSPASWNPLHMLSAVVAHGSWAHVIGNLIFFYAFAATLEVLLGPILYVGVLLLLAFGTQIAYSLASLGQVEALPTLGLSGVVTGAIALFCYFLPHARIRCLLWLLIFFRRFSVRAWILAVWFIGFDLYHQLTGTDDSGTNLIAHLSGAALGLLMGLIFFRDKRHWAQGLIQDH